MECEDEFGIRISDDDASATRTPGQLARLVIRLMRQGGALPPARVCPSSRVFYEVRRELMDAGVERSRIRPGARIGRVLRRPRDVRRAQHTLRTRLGGVTRRTRTDHALRFLAPALVIAAASLLAYSSASRLADMLAAAACVCVLLVFLLVGAWYGAQESALVDPDQTLGELIHRSVSGAAPFHADPEGLMVWLRVRAIVAEQLGLSISDVTPDADFVRDLGLT